MKSIWQAGALPSFEKLEGDAKTDVLVIGGGMAGLLCAHFLRQAGVDSLLVEAEAICSGVTQNTTAKITAQHGLLYDQLLKGAGLEKARMYLEANQRALAQYKTLCGSISCDFAEKDAYVYSLNDARKIDQELEALHKLGFKANFASRLPLPLNVVGAVRFPNQAQFDPLRFAAGIARGLRIYEHTRVMELGDHVAVTPGGTIKAGKIIVATHFPFLNKHGGYFIKQYQHRSYVIALEGGPDVKGMYVDEAQNGLSFRNQAGFLLLGGGDHRTGKTGGNWAELRDFAKLHYPDAPEGYHWATQDCMSLDGVPYIGAYSKSTPDLLVATGFNKWGMTSSMVAAMLLTDLVRGVGNPFAAVFDPSRSVWKPQLLLNGLESVVNLLTPTKPRCPHLGCALKWNEVERSWDCPCHGSRFGEGGELLDNPANGDLQKI
ncbi:MAG: FAD-dependent oxidoreductase [Candidatus Pelethousia sp.]|nr:FAD-dependent oxidoreductase [Candidatus Pelethousia sp.]